LANAIKHCPSLEEIVFDQVRMRYCHYKLIMNVMLANENIHSLSFQNGKKVKQSLHIFANHLSICDSLTSLRLTGVELEDSSLAYLMMYINKNNKLTCLEVDSNKITFKSTHLLNLFTENKSITYLNLNGNTLPQERIDS
jgi:hypothetical protein